jgi:hypothetical protein
MPNTTNFNWSTPADTDLVKNGASAIRTLGSAIDTSFVDFKGGTTGQVLKKTSNTDLDVEWGTASSGLTLINTTSFSAVASQSVNDVFSATYDNYLIQLTLSGSTTDDVNMRMRVGGSDNSSTNYVRSYFSQSSTSLTGQLISGETSFRQVARMRSGQSNFSQMTIINPFATAHTTIIQDNTDQVGTVNLLQTRIMHTMTVTTSYTGFTVIAASGNITGSVSVFAYAK